ncbi:MAG: hypothetical protein ACI9MJ_000958 [Alphaproteobacteria bacterium]|jgi:hypothetical protein
MAATAQNSEHKSEKTPISAPWAWSSADIASSDDWIYWISPDVLAEINQAVEGVKQRGIAFETVTRDDFPLPGLEADCAAMRRKLHEGRGFCLIKGVPVDGYDDDTLSLIHWGIGAHLGLGVSQSYRGDKIGHVTDMTHTGDTRRAYRSPGGLMMHVDPVDVVGLFCLRKARAGGESLISSSLAIYNAILAERPDLLEVLNRGYRYHHAEKEGILDGKQTTDHRVPVFGACDGRIVCKYVPFTISRGVADGVLTHSPEEAEAFAFIDEVASRPDIRYEMDLEVGDIQYLNNRLVLHGRHDYQDFERLEEKRHMLRLWLKMEEWPALPQAMISRPGYDEQRSLPVAAAVGE